eukprot:s117_g9.t1
MRRGFRTRAETRVDVRGKEARRKQAEELVDGLKGFQDRLKTLMPDDPADEDEDEDKKEAEPGTLASYWEEGDEETDKDFSRLAQWLWSQVPHIGRQGLRNCSAQGARLSGNLRSDRGHWQLRGALAAARKRRNDKLVPSMRRQNPLEKCPFPFYVDLFPSQPHVRLKKLAHSFTDLAVLL